MPKVNTADKAGIHPTCSDDCKHTQKNLKSGTSTNDIELVLAGESRTNVNAIENRRLWIEKALIKNALRPSSKA